MTDGPEPEYEPMADIARASDEMIAMAGERHAKQEVLREAQAVIDNAEWNSLTRAEQDARIVREEAEYQAHFDEMAAEAKADAEEAEADAEAEAEGDAKEAQAQREAEYQAALDDPEPEPEIG